MSKLLLRPEKILKLLLTATLLAVPLYPKFPLFNVPGIYVAIRLEDFLIMFLSIATVYFIKDQIKALLKEPVIRAVLIYFAVGAISLLSAFLITQTVSPHIGVLHLLRRIEYFIPFLAAFTYLRKYPHDLEYFVKLLFIIVFLIFIYGYGQKHFSWPVIITQNEEYSKGVALRWIPGSHIGSTFAGHYDLATYLVFVMPIFVSLFFTLKGKLTRIVLFLSFLAGCWLLANAISRISILSYFTAITISLIFLKKYKEILIVGLISLIFFGMSSDLLGRYLRVIEVAKMKFMSNIKVTEAYAQENAGLPKRRFDELTNENIVLKEVFEDRSTSIRLNVEWPRAARAFTKNPLLGTGYSSITLATDNDYLRLLGETGILGFIAFGLVFLRLIIFLIKSIPRILPDLQLEKAFLAGIFGGVIGIMINALFIDVIEASKFAISFWLMIGMAMAVGSRKQYE